MKTKKRYKITFKLNSGDTVAVTETYFSFYAAYKAQLVHRQYKWELISIELLD